MMLSPTRTLSPTLLRSRYAGALLALCCAAMALPAAAQWGWKEKNGQRVFSDQQPPAYIADKDIFKRPAGSQVSTAPAAPPAATAGEPNAAAPGVVAAASAAAPASAPKPNTKETELEKKKKEAEAAEAAKKKTAEQERAKARADNCERAKRALAQFNSGVRIAQTNEKGEREILSDTQRASETKRLQDITAQDCKTQ